MAYLLDANVFIAAKNLHYGLDFCPAFWDWLVAQNGTGRVFSIEKVGDEVQAVADELSTWAAARGEGFFLKPDAKVVPSLAAVSNWATSQKYAMSAISTFLQVADYYLVAHAQAGSHKAKDEKAPLSEIIEVLNERFGTQFSEEDRLFFQQIKEKACKSEHVIQTAMANPLDKFELGIRKLIEEMMIERMGENDKIVTRYMADQEFQGSAFPILAREIFETVRAQRVRPPGGATD